MTESYIQANGIKICYETFGNITRFPIILIHGIGATKETWKAQSEGFNKGSMWLLTIKGVS
ncbi:MAG: hypothetical protein GF383_06640 [Candidatus Lokiarchaeota archaeon]|nr:hypothetical protein [Candidatus Lokiarchaeota archaeon]MBD3339769.1 hypothetical protein [Candidatus Lokiarchaeota archaeon]